MTYVGHSTSERNLLFKPSAILSQWGVFLSELVNSELDVELMGIRIGERIFLEFIDHLRPVLIVGSWVENFFFFDFLLLSLCLFGFFSCFFSFLSLKFFLLFQSLLLIFTELLSSFSCLNFLFWKRLYFLFQGLLHLFRLISLHRS